MPQPLDIDAHGRVVPGNEQARRALADRAGHFQLLSTAPDLFLARRKPAVGGASPSPRCMLAGDLTSFPIADFVGFIYQSRLSGLLSVASSGVDRTVLFKDGEVRGAQSEATGERIGEIALRLGHVTLEQLNEAIALSSEIDKLFGKILIDKGFLSAADLWKCLHEQVASVFHGILLAREGVFTIVDTTAQDLGTPLSVNTQHLLMDGIRRIDEMSLFQARIPGPQAFLRRREPKVPTTLQALEQQLLGLIDGRRSVAELARSAHLNAFDTTKILYHLAEAGYVEATTEPSPGAFSERVPEIAAGLNGILHEIASALATVNALDPLLSGARTYLADPSNRFAPLWKDIVPRKDGTIDADLLLANLAGLTRSALEQIEPNGDRAQLLFEALRELMLFYLFQASERLPREVDDRLGLDVKRRFEALGGLR